MRWTEWMQARAWLPARRRPHRRDRHAGQGRHVQPGPAPTTPAAGAAAAAGAPGAPDACGDAPACGWFDSSHELARGLRITEHERADEVARLVPLAWWLAWELDEPAPPVR